MKWAVKLLNKTLYEVMTFLEEIRGHLTSRDLTFLASFYRLLMRCNNLLATKNDSKQHDRHQYVISRHFKSDLT